MKQVQVRIKKTSRPAPLGTPDNPDLRDPSGKLLPY